MGCLLCVPSKPSPQVFNPRFDGSVTFATIWNAIHTAADPVAQYDQIKLDAGYDTHTMGTYTVTLPFGTEDTDVSGLLHIVPSYVKPDQPEVAQIDLIHSGGPNKDQLLERKLLCSKQVEHNIASRFDRKNFFWCPECLGIFANDAEKRLTKSTRARVNGRTDASVASHE